jgi:hypothetical protein
LHDVAQVVGGAMKDQRRAILAHVNRMFQLRQSELKNLAGRNESALARIHALHRRICELESQLRRYRKSGALPR